MKIIFHTNSKGYGIACYASEPHCDTGGLMTTPNKYCFNIKAKLFSNIE